MVYLNLILRVANQAVDRKSTRLNSSHHTTSRMPSSEHFEQQQEQYEEGKYNMNNLSSLNTTSYCI